MRTGALTAVAQWQAVVEFVVRRAHRRRRSALSVQGAATRSMIFSTSAGASSARRSS
ncbi:hypothetical protein X551_03470 [Methylibium sp. T29]|nr:hypothetical protein X551_03470 [Methylibium sp. T29]